MRGEQRLTDKGGVMPQGLEAEPALELDEPAASTGLTGNESF
jgi:hypothetical protein